MERKVCFISVTGNWGWGFEGVGTGRVDSCPKVNSPPENEWARAITGGGRGLHVEKVQSALTVILKLVIGGLIIHLDYLKNS